MRAALDALVGIILPRRAHTRRTLARDENAIPLTIATHELLRIEITTLMNYRDARVRDLIHTLKYDGMGHAAHLCASILEDYLREEIAIARRFSPRPIIIMPVPLHRDRRRERGFNQIDIVLERLPKDLRDGSIATYASQLLSRTKKTPQQTHLSRADRVRNVRGAFALTGSASVAETHVFLVDDVTTTGATLASAGATLRRAGAHVTLIALARA